jgi:hypothetical protein
MGDNMLQKEFRNKDVQRMRNILTKNYNDKTTVQVGYKNKYIEYKEGDIWNEGDKTWTIKNGIKQTVTRFDEVKRKLFMPIVCPNCGRPMVKGRIDKYMYSIHQKCLDCVIEYETQLKREGKFQEYQRDINIQSISFHIKEMENVLLELIMDNNNEQFVTENGEIEEWKGNGILKQKMIEDIQEYINKLKDMLVL